MARGGGNIHASSIIARLLTQPNMAIMIRLLMQIIIIIGDLDSATLILRLHLNFKENLENVFFKLEKGHGMLNLVTQSCAQ